MQDREARELRRRVARLRRGRPGFRFSPALRERITAWVTVQRERGAWWCDVAREIGVPAETLKRWATPCSTSSTLRPVEVIDAPPVGTGTVTLVSPTGLRIEGVAIVDAIAILRGLQ
ncbi:MAG: hypothetical protein AB7T06_29660 [Kofleriaceae bacterium]